MIIVETYPVIRTVFLLIAVGYGGRFGVFVKDALPALVLQ